MFLFFALLLQSDLPVEKREEKGIRVCPVVEIAIGRTRTAKDQRLAVVVAGLAVVASVVGLEVASAVAVEEVEMNWSSSSSS